MMTFDEYIFSIITRKFYVTNKYCEYFQPEIKPLFTQENIDKYQNNNNSLTDDKFIEKINKDAESDFYEKRREGQNDDYLCELIRNSKIKEFIIFVEQSSMPLDSEIKKSFFETNQHVTDEYKISLMTSSNTCK